MSAARLRHLVPRELDIQTFDGTSWIGLVPFRMQGVMRRPLPDLPGVSAFEELNVRLYVEKDGKSGVYFLSLDANNALAGKGLSVVTLCYLRRFVAFLQELISRYDEASIDVTQEVKAAFDDAVKAREDEQRFKNEAEAYSNDILPRARGGAARLLSEAEGYKASVIARAEGDAAAAAGVMIPTIRFPAVVGTDCLRWMPMKSPSRGIVIARVDAIT